jgi:hypothetical protein
VCVCVCVYAHIRSKQWKKDFVRMRIHTDMMDREKYLLKYSLKIFRDRQNTLIRILCFVDRAAS